MASAFKNAGQQNPTTDDATADVYTAPSNVTVNKLLSDDIETPVITGASCSLSDIVLLDCVVDAALPAES